MGVANAGVGGLSQPLSGMCDVKGELLQIWERVSNWGVGDWRSAAGQ